MKDTLGKLYPLNGWLELVQFDVTSTTASLIRMVPSLILFTSPLEYTFSNVQLEYCLRLAFLVVINNPQNAINQYH